MFCWKVKFAVLLLLSFLCCGCFGGFEPDQVAYVAAIGIDKADQKGMYNFSYQFDVTKAFGTDSKDTGDKPVGLITIQAPSLAEARNLLNSLVSFKVTLTHIKALIVSDEVAREGIGKVFGPINRFREYRGSMYVMVVKDNARQFLEKFKPLLKVSPSKYYELIMTTQEASGYYLDTSLHQLNKRMKSNSAQPYAALIGVNTVKLDSEPSTGKTNGSKVFGYEAGKIPQTGDNLLEFAGTAVFKGDKMVGVLSTTETRILSFLLGHPSHGYMVVEDPLDKKESLNLQIRLGSKPDIKAVMQDGIPTFKIKLEIEGEITAITSGINYEQKEYLSLLESQVSQILYEDVVNLIKKTQMLESDVVGFGFYLRPNFKLNKDFAEYQWNQHYSEAVFEVEVKVKLRRTGLMIKSAPIL